MYRFILVIVLLHILSIFELQAQSDDMKVKSREVLVSHKDSLERAHIRVCTPKRKIRNPKKYYYWFYSGHINSNQGAYNENPLQGHYFVYNKTKQLITKGFFNNGKKGRKWMYWYADGTLKRSERWHWGYQWGKTKTFNEKGEKIAKLRYKKGVQIGKQRYYQGDSVVVKKYEKGIEIPVVAKNHVCKDSCFIKKTWKKLFVKKAKNNSEAVGTSHKHTQKLVADEARQEPTKPKLTKEEKEAQKAMKRQIKAEKKRQKTSEGKEMNK